MLERLDQTAQLVTTLGEKSPRIELAPSETIPVTPLIFPSLKILSSHEQLVKVYDDAFAHMRRLRNRLPNEAPRETILFQARQPATPMSAADLLPSTKQFLDRAANPPLLPAPPAFEDIFRPFEPMFHTVFYRRYPYDKLDDAKQNAMLHLWKHWKKDMRLMEQTAAYVVQFAIWGASPHRKIKKEKLIDERELPMLKYERYIDVRIADQSRDPGWMLRSDLRHDVQLAIEQICKELRTQENGEAWVQVLEDIVAERTIVEGRQKRSQSVSFRGYKQMRDEILTRLKGALLDYAPA